MYLLRQALSRCTSCNAQYPNGKYASIEAALRHAHYNYKIPPCSLQEQDHENARTGERGRGRGRGRGRRKRDLVDEDDEDMTSSGSSSEEEDSGSYDNTPPQRDKRPCDAKGQHYVLQQESLNDPQENVDDDELAVKHVSLQLLVFGERRKPFFNAHEFLSA